MSNEFISELEKIMPAEELNFPPTPAFGKYKPFLEHAIAHPAKANTKLIEFLILKYTKPGDTVLDPMAGSGSTGVVAALHNRNAIQIDIEEKFYKWMEEARLKVEKHPTFIKKGWIKNICGDARKLSEILSKIDVCITSPPYADMDLSGGDVERRRERLLKSGYDPKDFIGGRARNAVLKGYSEVNAIITSPPYSDTISRQGGPATVKDVGISTLTAREYSSNPDNIGNIPLGNVSVIITSPPYADAKKGGEANAERMAERWDEKFREKGESWDTWGKTWRTPGRMKGLEALGSGYSNDKSNIGNLPFGKIDTIITSPPYEGSLEGTSRHTCGGVASRDPKLAQTGTYADVVITSPPYDNAVHCRGHSEYQEKLTEEKKLFMDEYGKSNANIGNLKSSDEEYEALVEGLMTRDGKPTYLSEMLKVYSEMYKVLKPGGLAIIIVKPFIRNKKVVDLPYYTWILMSKVGFKLEKLYKLRLQNQSFWRILYYKKNPNILRIAHEYVIVARKQS
jgi:DNA modification methylase